MQISHLRSVKPVIGPLRAGIAVAILVGLSLPSTWAQETSDLTLPMTLDKVWYRAGQKKGLAGLRAFKAAGDLTLSEEGLEFHGGKDSFSIPLSRITMVSLGKLGRDVDTDWAVVGLLEGGLDRIIAFKDGKAFGYGQDTPVIFQTIKDVMKQLGAAQYAAPVGSQSFTLFDDQLAFSYPEDWFVHMPSSISIGNRTPWGLTLFSSLELDGGRELANAKAIRKRVANSASREFFLLREEAGSHVGCKGFKPKALPGLLKRATSDPVFEGGSGSVEPLGSQPITLAGCEGLRVLAKGRGADDQEVIVDLRMVAKRDTLYIFGVRIPAAEHAGVLEVFEPVVDSVRFALVVE